MIKGTLVYRLVVCQIVKKRAFMSVKFKTRGPSFISIHTRKCKCVSPAVLSEKCQLLFTFLFEHYFATADVDDVFKNNRLKHALL